MACFFLNLNFEGKKKTKKIMINEKKKRKKLANIMEKSYVHICLNK